MYVRIFSTCMYGDRKFKHMAIHTVVMDACIILVHVLHLISNFNDHAGKCPPCSHLGMVVLISDI